jgi:hypothetical protein
MLIKNLVLSFVRQEEGQIIFQTETRLEVAIAAELLADFQNNNQPFYLNFDSQPYLAMSDNQKQILNEILDPKD